jgi:hypothetical protein
MISLTQTKNIFLFGLGDLKNSGRNPNKQKIFFCLDFDLNFSNLVNPNKKIVIPNKDFLNFSGVNHIQGFGLD